MALPTTVSGLGLQLSCSGVGVVLQDVINASAKMDKRNKLFFINIIYECVK